MLRGDFDVENTIDNISSEVNNNSINAIADFSAFLVKDNILSNRRLKTEIKAIKKQKALLEAKTKATRVWQSAKSIGVTERNVIRDDNNNSSQQLNFSSKQLSVHKRIAKLSEMFSDNNSNDTVISGLDSLFVTPKSETWTVLSLTPGYLFTFYI